MQKRTWPISSHLDMLFTGLGLVRIVKNCDLGLENLRSQFFTVRTSQTANNIFLLENSPEKFSNSLSRVVASVRLGLITSLS